MKLDLTKTDVYETTQIPNKDYETTLKVLRTLAGWAKEPGNKFESDTSELLEAVHARLVKEAEPLVEGSDEPDPVSEVVYQEGFIVLRADGTTRKGGDGRLFYALDEAYAERCFVHEKTDKVTPVKVVPR